MTAETKRKGFFEVSISGLKATVQARPQAVLPAVYVVLCAGVDNTRQSLPRACTHAERSAQRRLAKRLFLKSEIANAIAYMVTVKLLVDLTPADGKRKAGAATYQVSPGLVDDLVPVSHNFIGIKVSKEGNSRKHELHPGSANLAGMLEACNSLAGEVDLEQVQIDSLLTYFHLLKRQDFKAYGGVDPSAVSGTFGDCRPGENPVHDESYLPVAGGKTAQIRFAVAPEHLNPSPAFAEEVLTGVAVDATCTASLETRMKHAIDQLLKAKLLYRVAVLWSDDPRERTAKPVATIAIRGSWLPASSLDQPEGDPGLSEFSAQEAIDKLLQHWCTLARSQLWTSDAEYVFSKTGIYRYVVLTADKEKWVLLDQYRVRWWPDTDDNLTAIGFDERRSKNYLHAMNQRVSPDVENY